MEKFFISINILCHIYFLIVHMISFGMTPEQYDFFQRSNKHSINLLRYFANIFHFSLVLVFSVTNGINCSKNFAKNEIIFWSKYSNYVKAKYFKFAKYYYLFIVLYNLLVNFVIKEEAKNVELNQVCKNTIIYKILFLANFHKKYVSIFEILDYFFFE